MVGIEGGAPLALDDCVSAKTRHEDDDKCLHDLYGGPPSPLPKYTNLAVDREPDDYNDEYPEGGRGWIVVLGCFLQATITLGKGVSFTGAKRPY